MAETQIPDDPQAPPPGDDGGSGVPPGPSLFEEALEDLFTVFTTECGKGLKPRAQRTFSALFAQSVGHAILNGQITEWNDEQKAYVYPHVRGIAARVAARCGRGDVSHRELREAAHPWIIDARGRAKRALKRLARAGAEAGDPASLERFLTVYCDGYPDQE